jgi:hypothetical protein
MRRLILPLLASSLLALPAWAGAPPGPSAAAPSTSFYFSRALTVADLQGRTLRELSLMRNTIFARAGNPFRKDWLNSYFRAQPWYRPAKHWDPKKISALDWQNAKLLATFEAGLKKADLKARVATIQARIEAGKATPEDPIEMRLLSARLGKWQAKTPPPANRSPLEDPSMLDHQLTTAQLSNMSRRDLRLLRNTIYARHGYAFKSEMLSEYFWATEWYKEDPKFTSKRLSALDWRNVKLIKSVEKSLGGPMTDKEHMEADGWMSGA